MPPSKVREPLRQRSRGARRGCHNVQGFARAVSDVTLRPPALRRPAQRAALFATLLLLLALARGGAAAQSSQGRAGGQGSRSTIQSDAASGFQVTELGRAGSALERCNVPALAVDACLKRREPAAARRSSSGAECVELAAYVMSAPRLTRAGHDAHSHDTLHCTYVALTAVMPANSMASDTVFLLSLGLLLSSSAAASGDGGGDAAAWPLSLLRFDAAPLAQPRLQAREAELQAALREVYAAEEEEEEEEAPSAEALLRGAEALELFSSMRGTALATHSAAAVAAGAARVSKAQAAARSARQRQLLPAARTLALLLLQPSHGDAAHDSARAAFEARAGALLAALDVPSQGDCAALARRLEAHVALMYDRSADPAELSASLNVDLTQRLWRALRLTPVDACAHAVVAATSDVVALHTFMTLLHRDGMRRVVVQHMLPPPRGDAPRVKTRRRSQISSCCSRWIASREKTWRRAPPGQCCCSSSRWRRRRRSSGSSGSRS
jgi:hypothetical protein